MATKTVKVGRRRFSLVTIILVIVGGFFVWKYFGTKIREMLKKVIPGNNGNVIDQVTEK